MNTKYMQSQSLSSTDKNSYKIQESKISEINKLIASKGGLFNFSKDNNLDRCDVFAFVKANSLAKEKFVEICKALSLDPENVNGEKKLPFQKESKVFVSDPSLFRVNRPAAALIINECEIIGYPYKFLEKLARDGILKSKKYDYKSLLLARLIMIIKQELKIKKNNFFDPCAVNKLTDILLNNEIYYIFYQKGISFGGTKEDLQKWLVVEEEEVEYCLLSELKSAEVKGFRIPHFGGYPGLIFFGKPEEVVYICLRNLRETIFSAACYYKNAQ